MNRDFDLIRKIMTDIEMLPSGECKQQFEYPEIDTTTALYHVALLIDAGLIRGKTEEHSEGIDVIVFDLTWNGHDFLDAMKDDNLWNKAKENILKPGMSFTFDLLLEYLKFQVKQKIGLP